MTTPIDFQPLAPREACENGIIVMGAPVAQMALGLKQLNQVKFRSAGFYHVGHGTFLYYSSINYAQGAYNRGWLVSPAKGYQADYDFFYFSQPTSQWVGVEIVYGASSNNIANLSPNGPNIIVSLYNISGGSIVTKIDEGCRFTYPQHLEIIDRGEATGVSRVNTGSRLFTFPSGGISAPTFPRPLYIPQAYRGQELVVRVEATEVVIYAVHLFDLFLEA